MRQALAVMMLTAFGSIGPALADEQKGANEAGQKQTYLGVSVQALPASLASQLTGVVPKGEGVLMRHVVKDSPAAKAGLQENDILVSFGDRKVTAPEELAKLVHGDKANQQVTLGIIRGGKSESCKATLGTHEVPEASGSTALIPQFPDDALRRAFAEFAGKNGNVTWESFDALKLTRLDTKRWRAEIDYRNKGAKKEHKVFEGTREEIRKAIQAAKDMPANEQHHLLRAMNMHEPMFEFHFPLTERTGPEF